MCVFEGREVIDITLNAFLNICVLVYIYISFVREHIVDQTIRCIKAVTDLLFLM